MPTYPAYKNLIEISAITIIQQQCCFELQNPFKKERNGTCDPADIAKIVFYDCQRAL